MSRRTAVATESGEDTEESAVRRVNCAIADGLRRAALADQHGTTDELLTWLRANVTADLSRRLAGGQ